MVQHELLLTVAPLLIVVSRPWIRLWRTLPLEARRWLAAGAAHGGGAWGPLRRLSRKLGEPAPTFVLFNGVLLVWHLPVLFNATLHSVWLHVAEHTMFFVTGLMFWKQVVPSPPLRARLNEVQRCAYLVGAMVVSWGLALVIAVWATPLYPYYADEVSRPGGISALADQHLAAGVMWVPGSISFTIVFLVYVYRWLTPQAPAPLPATRLAGDHR